MFRKNLIIFCAVFVSTHDINTQALFAFAIILSGCVLHVLYEPYDDKTLNDLDNHGILTLKHTKHTLPCPVDACSSLPSIAIPH